MMSRKRDVGKSAQMEVSRYSSDIFSLVSILCVNTLTIANHVIKNKIKSNIKEDQLLSIISGWHRFALDLLAKF